MKVAFIESSVVNVEPLGIEYLARSLKGAGHEVKYFETPRRNFMDRLKAFNPDILCYSITSGEHRAVRELNRYIRSKIRAKSLFGGPHCTFFPEYIESDELIDGICRGEGDYALVELLQKISREEDYSRTPNWWLRIDRNIYRNEVRTRISDLDALPFPDREVVYSENMDLRDTPIKRILGSRGCPYTCSYCFNRQYNNIYRDKGKIYYRRSLSNIIQEITGIRRKHPVTFLKFVEDIFGLDMDYDEFARTYKKEVDIPFICNIRPNLINEHKVKKLKEAGCAAVTLAVESGHDFIRNKVLNRNLSADELENAIRLLKDAGMRVWTQNIIANPGETFDMAMETYSLNVRNRVNFAECLILTPYPGTAIYDYCVKNKYFDGDKEKLPSSFLVDSCLRFDSEKEKRRLVNFHKFFSFSVQHPHFLPVVNLLIELPPNRLFVLFSRLYDHWKIARVIRARFSLKSLVATVRTNLRFILTYFFNLRPPA